MNYIINKKTILVGIVFLFIIYQDRDKQLQINIT